MEQRQVRYLTQPSKTDSPLHGLFDTVADHCVTMGAHQDRRAIPQYGSQGITPLHRAHQSRGPIKRRAIG